MIRWLTLRYDLWLSLMIRRMARPARRDAAMRGRR